MNNKNIKLILKVQSIESLSEQLVPFNFTYNLNLRSVMYAAATGGLLELTLLRVNMYILLV